MVVGVLCEVGVVGWGGVGGGVGGGGGGEGGAAEISPSLKVTDHLQKVTKLLHLEVKLAFAESA